MTRVHERQDIALLVLGGCGDDAGGGPEDAGRDANTASVDSGAVDDASTDSGAAPGDGATPRLDAGGPGPGQTEIVVAVGWQGLQVVSIDEGRTWCQTGLMVVGHDDLFRGGGHVGGLPGALTGPGSYCS